MHIIRNIILLSILIVLFLPACKKRENRQAEKPLWSSTDPFTIPTKNRVQKYLKGNLVENPSFEQGKQFPIDTASHFYVDGWQKVGDRVQWTDIRKDSVFAAHEASHMNRAIKVSRSIANETQNKGEGIQSNYIKVIPGNYDFTFDLKLKDIKPYSKRLGTKLYDAIDIQVQFYDKNKNPISGKLYSPILKKHIDYSIKNYPLSNYWEIKEMDWTRIRGRSFEPLVMEGIIPNQAQYVRLFFGLKGAGTMWVDHVDFRYAATNLSLLEQMQIYNDSVASPYNLLIPKPRNIQPSDTIDYQQAYYKRPNDIVLLIPSGNHQSEMKVAQDLKKQLTVLHDSLPTVPEVRIQTHLSSSQINDHPLVISLGPTNLYNKYKELLPADSIKAHEQGYFIYTISDLAHVIFAGTQSSQGIIYAGNTIKQLIDASNKVIYNASIIDFPSFRKRGLVVGNVDQEQYNTVMDHLDLLSNYNFNHIVFDQENSILEAGTTHERLIKQFTRSPLNQLFSSAVLINPFLESQLVDPYDTNYQCYDLSQIPKHLNHIVNKYGHLETDDYYIGFGENNFHLIDKCITENIAHWDLISTIQSHTTLIHELSQKFKTIRPDAGIAFIPSGLQEDIFFDDQGELSVYYNNIFKAIDGHSKFVWGGENTRSPIIDYANFYRFSQFVDDYPHILYNDVQLEGLGFNEQRAGSLLLGNKRLYSLFSPCQLDYFLPEKTGKHSAAISFGLDILSAVDMIRYLTYADYAWNKEQYDPVESIWRILTALYGHENTASLIQFNDAFVTMLEMINTPTYKIATSRFKKTGKTVITNMETHYQELANSGTINKDLLTELKTQMDHLIYTYNSKIDRIELNSANSGMELIN